MHPSKWKLWLCRLLTHLNLPGFWFSPLFLRASILFFYLPSYSFTNTPGQEPIDGSRPSPAVQSSLYGAFSALDPWARRLKGGFLHQNPLEEQEKNSKPVYLYNSKKIPQPFHPQSVTWLYLIEDKDTWSYFLYICNFRNDRCSQQTAVTVSIPVMSWRKGPGPVEPEKKPQTTSARPVVHSLLQTWVVLHPHQEQPWQEELTQIRKKNPACGAEVYSQEELTTPPASHLCPSPQGTLQSMILTSSRTLVLGHLSHNT